ncbi:nestin [Astyanax mexicanus]|uniref:nestin n=1 Tax=Astyanax mexicanus TaxID=7994 RepID=UPI0020CB5BD3|nr:nestin [Astyanax mexicanus]
MEMTSIRELLPHVGEEKYQMLELNKRLESYLGRVKLLEEENQLLRGEIQSLRRKGNTKGQKQVQEEALHQARREVQAAWMEKDRVEMEVSNLMEEMEALNAQRQKEKAAQAEAKRKLAESKKRLEDEWRTQIWLREQAAHLQKEVTLQVQVHEEEMESLKSTTVLTKSVLLAPQSKQTFSLRDLGEDYSQRAAQAWQEAASVYQKQVEQLEDSLNQTRTSMTQINLEKKENQLYLQDLAKEMESSKAKRELLEKNMEKQRNRQGQELQNLQAQVEGLEAEKVDLREQIGDLLVDRRNLLQMKMCLGLEVATYRALLDSESLRVNSQSPLKTSTQTVSFLEALPKPHRTHSGTQATSVSSHFSSPLTTTSRLITPSKADLMTPALSRSMTQSSQETHRRVQMSEREKTGMSEETTQFERTSRSISTRSFSVTGAVPFTTAEKSLEASYVTTTSASVVSAPMVPLAVEEPGSIPSTHVEEDLQEMPIENQSNAGPHTSDTEEEAALISQLPAGHPSSLPPSPEREVPFDRHAEDTRASDEGEDEETEVSTEMAQISHAPMSAWEENDTTVPEEKDIVSEQKSQAIRVNYVQQCSVEATLAYLQQLDENSENLVSPSFAEMSLHSMDAMNQDEKNYQSDILGLVDVTERVSNVSEEVFLKSEPEIKNESTESYEIMDNKTKEMEDMVQFDHYGTEAKEGHHSDMELQEAETVRQVKESKEEKEIDREEEEREKDIEKVEEEDDEKYVAFQNKSLTNTQKEDMVKDSSDPQDSETEVDVHRSSAQEPAEQADELVMKINDKDSMVEEDHPEEDKSDEDEESLNISASWRTDPGDADTLADTRPLIHYKSDDEADANTQASHFGVSEHSDSEDEREKHEGALMWGQTTAKRFDTMEDLSEEPEIITSDDVVMDKSAHTLVEEVIDEIPNKESVGLVADEDLQSKSEDLDINVHTQKDDALEDLAENDFRICEERSEEVELAMKEKTEEDINEVQNLLVQKQVFSLESFLSETRDIREQPSIGEDDTAFAQFVVEQNIDEIPNEESVEPVDDEDLQSKCKDQDIEIHTPKDDVLVDQSVNEFNICEESKQGFRLAMEDKTEEEINQFQNLLDESSFTHSQQLGLEAFLSETRDINEQPNTGEDETTISQTVVEENNDEIANEESEEPVDYEALQSKSHSQDRSQSFLTEAIDSNGQPNIDEEEATNPYDHKNEICDMDYFTQNKSDDGATTQFDYFPLATDSTPQPEEASQEQALDEKPSEMSPKPSETSNSDAFPFETILTKEKVCVKEEEDEQSHISMVTYADFTDNISLYSGPNSRPDSQTNVDHSDLEESNSSEDESPNASQCSQLFSHSGISTEELDSSNAATVGEALKAHDSMSLTGFLEETLVKSFGQDCFAEGENLSQHHEEHEELPVENSSSGIDEDSNSVPKMQECETLDLDHQDETTGASHDILSAEADLNDLRQDNESEKLDIFQDNVLNEEPQEPKEKENDSHSFFSSSIKEDIWNISKFEMAATYDSHGSTETERYSPDTLHPNQSMAFGEDWGQIGSLKPANGKPEKEISAGQSDEEEEVEEEREEQKMPKAKQPQCKDAKDGVAEAVQSDDSIEEGDSWSSGEE